LRLDEGLDVGIGEHPPLALPPAADVDIFQGAGANVFRQGAGRAAEAGGDLARGQEGGHAPSPAPAGGRAF
jgi:hypothetical protein